MLFYLQLLLTIILIVHGLIHLLGTVKAFEWAQLDELSRPISKPEGIMWLGTCLLFLALALFVWRPINSSQPILVIALILSQFLIIRHWKDARFGTLPNLVIAVLAFFLIP